MNGLQALVWCLSLASVLWLYRHEGRASGAQSPVTQSDHTTESDA